MKRNKEDNTVAVIQRAVRDFNIPITKISVREALKSHSNYPTFRSICDALSVWKVEHYPLKYKPEELLNVPAPSIVHFSNDGGQLAFVSEIKNNIVTYFESYNLKRKTELSKFIKRCSGAIIVLNPNENSGEREYRKKWQEELIGNAVLPVIVFTFLLFTTLEISNYIPSGIFSSAVKSGFLFLTKIAGIVLSMLLVFHEFEIHNSLTDKLCHINQSTNCNTVLNDKSAKFFGWFGWADTGFIYFTGGLLIMLQGFATSYLSLLAISSALSLPYPFFSVFYQGFVLKKWCPLCLGVQLVLISEFILLLPMFSMLHFTFPMISGFILTYLVTGIVYTLIILYFRGKTSNEIIYSSNLKFKRDPNILKFLMLNQKHYEFSVTDKSLVFGAKYSPITITAFLSLNCSPCAKAFEKIKDILQSGEKVSINIVMITDDSKILNALYFYSRQNKNEEAIELLNTWYNAHPYSRNKLSENLCIPEIEDYSKEVINENYKLFEECNLTHTPTFFINGYQLPNQYDIEDIVYFKEFFGIEKKFVSKIFS
jgi:uncharacterized membrane protein